jgi:hypothetical protein
MKLTVYRALMAQEARLLPRQQNLSVAVWSRALAIRTDNLLATRAFLELQRRNAELMEVARIVASNPIPVSNGVLAVKRHVRSSMLDEQVANWIRNIDESDLQIDWKPTPVIKKRGEGQSFLVPDFCGSSSVH